MNELDELHRIQAQLAAPQQRANLVNLYCQTLRETLFDIRSQVRPSSIEQIASDLASAMLEFLQAPDLDLARQHGVRLCQSGLDDKTLLRLGLVTRQFCLTHLGNILFAAMLETIDAYHSTVIEGFIRAREAKVLEEQERLRSALHRTLSRYASKMELAAKVAEASTSTLELDEMLHVAVELVREHLNLYYVGIFLVEDPHPEAGEHPLWAILCAGTGEAGNEMLRRGHKLQVGGNSMIGWSVANAQARVALDASKEPIRFNNPLLPATRSELALPLVTHGRPIGVMTVQSTQEAAFSPEDITLLQTMVDQLANAIENVRLYQAERDALRHLQESQAQLIEAEKMAALGRLIASFAHEINNPLQALQGALTLVREENQSPSKPERMRRYMDIAEQSTERIANIMHRVRGFYRPTLHAMYPTDVHTVLEDVLQLTSSQLQRGNVTLVRDWAELPVVQANPGDLKQVFLNLVLNAVDAMAPQGGILRVGTALDELAHDGPTQPAVRIEISDTGKGIPPDVLPHIFEPLMTSRPDKATPTPEKASLGLSINYGIIQAHGGWITVTSRVGKGTTFTILLPARKPKS